MLTLSKPSDLSQATARSIQSTGFSSEPLNRANSLQPKLRTQARSSAAEQNDSSSFAPGKTRRAALSFAFRGRNATAQKIAGNGTTEVGTVRRMYNGSTLKFYSNGRFVFTPSGVGTIARSDLFPITGRYTRTSTEIRFSGIRTSSSLTSQNSAAINGLIYVEGGQVKGAVNQRTVITNVTNINGTPFSSTIDRTVRIDMNLVRIN